MSRERVGRKGPAAKSRKSQEPGDVSATDGALDHSFTVSVGQHVRDTRPARYETSLRQLFDQFQIPDTSRGKLDSASYQALRKEVPEEKRLRDQEKDGAYIMGAVFAKPGTRVTGDIEAMTCFIGDIDSGKTSEATLCAKLKGTAFLGYTSYSHTPKVPKLRVVIPYKAPIGPDQHAAVFDHFNTIFGGELDAACHRPAQVYFTPACPHDAAGDYRVFLQDGELFDAAAVKAKAPSPPQQSDEAIFSTDATRARNTIELDRVQSALAHISADERETWIKVGLALYNSFPDRRDSALMAWMDWSRSSAKFDHDDARDTWASFKTRPDGRRVTVASIYQLARQGGWNGAGGGESWVAEMNQKYFLSRSGGKTSVFEEKEDPVWKRHVLERMTIQDFQSWLANRRVPVADDRGGIKHLPIAKAWMEHPDRRQYEGIVLAPTAEIPGHYNLWRGFSVPPDQRPGWRRRCRKIRLHILKVICAGDRRTYRYLLRWMAFAVQHPDLPAEVAVVLRGGRGTGKGTFAEIFREIFGEHYLQISQVQHLTGNFNAHLRSCVFLFVDEGYWAGDRKGAGVLKSLITEPVIAIEAKGRDVESARNMLHIVIASNDEWVVPAGEQERRYLVLDVDESHQQDHAYFKALREEMAGGGVAALLRGLLNLDLSRFNRWEVPKTEALIEQKIRSLDSISAWWFESLRRGSTSRFGSVTGKAWGTPRAVETVVQEYRDQTGASRRTYVADATSVGMKLASFMPKGWQLRRRDTAPNAGGGREYVYHFPPLDDCRREFERKVGLAGYDWDGGQ